MTITSVHASCVLIGEGAILIRGASGAGKSTLALALIEAAGRAGAFARLVGDDRIALATRGGRLVARGSPAIVGRVEVRGLGILPVAFEAVGVVRLVVDLLDGEAVRLPERFQSEIDLCGVTLPRVASRIRPGIETAILRQYRALDDTLMME